MIINTDSLVWLHSASMISQNEGKSLLIGFGAYKKFSKATDLDPHKPAFYITDFFCQSVEPWIQYEQWLEILPSQLELFLNAEPLTNSVIWHIDTHQQTIFHQTFIELQQAFQKDKLQKAVPYIFAQAFEKMTRNRLIHLLKKTLSSLQNYPGYLYAHWDARQGFLGLTPELLFDYRQRQPFLLKTMALAGTKRDQESNENFIRNQKELKEHHLVIEGIKQAIQQLGQPTVGQTSILNLPNLKHLLTPIKIHLHHPFQFEKAVECLHPTPALGAFPQEEGRKWLEDYQTKIDRRSYGAPFGVYNPLKGNACCLVGIRQVQWGAQGMRMGAGCGIVAESSVDREWAEIQLKIQSIRNLLGL